MAFQKDKDIKARVSDAGKDVSFQRVMNKTIHQKSTEQDVQTTSAETPSPSAQDDKQSRLWYFVQMLRGNKDDLTNDTGFNLFSEPKILTAADLESKGELTADDIMMADTDDAAVANMPAIHVSNKDTNTEKYLTGRMMQDFIGTYKTNKTEIAESTTIGAAKHTMISKELDKTHFEISASGTTILNPELVKRMNKDPQVAHYVAVTQQEAAKAGIDGNMLANQFWQESRFNPKAKSGAGAMGVAQMMPFQQGKYGLESKSDFYDAEKSIHAGAQMMAHLTNKYGDQRLALVAYNGGGKAIDFVEKKLGKEDVSFNEWHDFMTDRREKLGDAKKGAWHVETLDYTNKIALGNPVQTTTLADNDKHPTRSPEPA